LEEERDDLAELMARTARPGEIGSRETVLAQHLAIATVSDPLTKIRYICEAARMLTPEERERYGVDEEWLEVAYRVAVSLMRVDRHPIISVLSPYYSKEDIEVSIGWAFTMDKENYKRYIKPWVHEGFNYWPSRIPKNNPPSFRTATNHLTESGYASIVAQFVAWAMPEAMRLANQITRSITPETYWEMIRLYRGEPQQR